VEIGDAVVESHRGRGIATDAVREPVRRVALRADVQRVVAHTPLDRPESARVVEKAGFTFVREIEDTHEGVTLRVKEWELRLR
jgi:RimJ/RimL family protein N-acetyltransferase